MVSHKDKLNSVASIAKEYGLTIKVVVAELKALDIKKRVGADEIEEELRDKVAAHFDKISGKEVVKEEPKPVKENVATKKEVKTEEVKEEATAKEAPSIRGAVTVRELADILGKKATDIVKELMKRNILATINQIVDPIVAKDIASGFGIELALEKGQEKQSKKEKVEKHKKNKKKKDKEEETGELVLRPPVVTFLGHVDHGKTSIQDAIRKTNVCKGESGGITQHTGASVADYDGRQIVFVDTPGHEAFTAMRARGANTTDIAVLVVAADDGFMPQTKEAMDHAKAAGVPIIVAINKIDMPTADPDKVLLHMQQNNLMSEDWGGDVGTVRVSAMTGEGLDDLLERILLESEMLELRGCPTKKGKCIVLESELKTGMGATANVLVKDGTIRVGDAILCEEYAGKVKALIDHKGKRVKHIGPSMPAQVLGLPGVPEAGSKLTVCKNEKKAVEKANIRKEEKRHETLAPAKSNSLEALFSSIEDEKRNDLKVIVKTDVQGTSEAIKDSLSKFPSDKIKVDVIHSAVGPVSESDILLASTSGAIVIGFHVKVNPGVNAVAKKTGVEIRLYSIIYELLEDIEDALVGRLAPEEREKVTAKAKILKIFSMTKGPKVCGCLVETGTVRVNSRARVYRDNELIFNGSVESLRRFQDQVKEVKSGQECGIRLDNFMEFDEGDVIEIYEVELRKSSL